MRWHIRSVALISPAAVHPIAEESDLICSLGEWALVTACRQLFEWDAGGHPHPRVWRERLGRQFTARVLQTSVARSLRERRINPSRWSSSSPKACDRRPREAVAGPRRAQGARVQIAVTTSVPATRASATSRLPVDCLRSTGRSWSRRPTAAAARDRAGDHLAGHSLRLPSACGRCRDAGAARVPAPARPQRIPGLSVLAPSPSTR